MTNTVIHQRSQYFQAGYYENWLLLKLNCEENYIKFKITETISKETSGSTSEKLE